MPLLLVVEPLLLTVCLINRSLMVSLHGPGSFPVAAEHVTNEHSQMVRFCNNERYADARVFWTHNVVCDHVIDYFWSAPTRKRFDLEDRYKPMEAEFSLTRCLGRKHRPKPEVHTPELNTESKARWNIVKKVIDSLYHIPLHDIVDSIGIVRIFSSFVK